MVRVDCLLLASWAQSGCSLARAEQSCKAVSSAPPSLCSRRPSPHTNTPHVMLTQSSRSFPDSRLASYLFLLHSLPLSPGLLHCSSFQARPNSLRTTRFSSPSLVRTRFYDREPSFAPCSTLSSECSTPAHSGPTVRSGNLPCQRGEGARVIGGGAAEALRSAKLRPQG